MFNASKPLDHLLHITLESIKANVNMVIWLEAIGFAGADLSQWPDGEWALARVAVDRVQVSRRALGGSGCGDGLEITVYKNGPDGPALERNRSRNTCGNGSGSCARPLNLP